ncbi:unnamed protein product [Cladocopium goreaui]|uniref:Large ribosomal subunit protein bL12 C-terminal domain-containing protein n=1 Tax=Cladocopium goreaui TaxID=2562237 RepID=A0A9P1GCD5_9DINO|nr:unnamed protein product [Cladocopium goreaui]
MLIPQSRPRLCKQHGFYIPKLLRRLNDFEMAKLQGLPSAVTNALMAAAQDLPAGSFGAAVGDAMSINVLQTMLRHLCDAAGHASHASAWDDATGLRRGHGAEELEKAGAPAAAPAAAASEAPAAEDEAPKEEVKKEEKKKEVVSVKLVSFEAAKKINVVKEVRAITQIGLKEAKELVESAPKVVKKGVPFADAEAMRDKLTAAGAED